MKKMLTGISAFAVLALMSSVASAAATPNPTNTGPNNPGAANPGAAPSSDPGKAEVVLKGTVGSELSVEASKVEPFKFKEKTTVDFDLTVVSNVKADLVFTSGF